MKFFKRAPALPPQPPQMPQNSFSVEDVVEMAGKCRDEAKAGMAVRLASVGKIAEAIRLLEGKGG